MHLTNNCQLAHINIMILKIRQIWFCDDGISGCIQVKGGHRAGYSYGPMLADNDVIFAMIVGRLSIVVDQLPKFILALILHLWCRNLSQLSERFL